MGRTAATPRATARDHVSEEEGFCYTCHAGAPATKNIQGEFLTGTNTASAIYHHPVVNSEQPSGRPVECGSCHNAHVAQSDATPPTAPAASARLNRGDRVSVTNGAK